MTTNQEPEARDLIALLRSAKTIAVVGASPRPDRPSHAIAQYLIRNGYRVIPVNPGHDRLLGETAYPDVASIPAEITVDIVDIFRRPEHIPGIVDQAIARGVRAVWMQLGLSDEPSAARARAAGLIVVMNHCIMVEHGRLLGPRRP
jgi:predicted CoA-binding protein